MKIVVDLGGTNIRCGLEENGKITQRVSAACPAAEAEDVVVAALEEQIAKLFTDRVDGIGIGVPSVVDSAKGIVYNVVNIPSWKEVHLEEILEKRFRVPVRINNDANCFALGEYAFGEGKGMKNMIGMTLGTGVGAGVIIDGRLYEGRNAGAGEIGSLPYLDSDYEHYSGSDFFKRFYHTTGGAMADEAAKGSEAARAAWKEFGKHVGKMIDVILFTYDPDAIIIGGGIAHAYPYYEAAMRESMADGFPYPKTVEKITVRFSLNPDSNMLGAAALFH